MRTRARFSLAFVQAADLPDFSWRRVRVDTILLAGLLTWAVAGRSTVNAAERYWASRGAGDKWSNPYSWIPVGLPQDGEDLVFGGILSLNTSGTMLNDIPGLTVHSLAFDYENEFFSEAWVLNGNGLTVTGDITCKALNVEINADVTLGHSIVLRRSASYGAEEVHTIRWNGALNLGDHELTIINEGPDPGVYRINSTVTGRGDLRFLNKDVNSDALVVFGGTAANTFSGDLGIERELTARPFHASFDKPGGNVVNGGLVIGHGCEVALHRGDQIGDDAVVSITGGGRLVLNGWSETIGNLALSNVHADAEPTLVDTGGTVTLRRGITTSVFNEGGAVPTINARLSLPTGSHIFDLNNALAGPGLVLKGIIAGPGGFSKFGNGTLVLGIGNTFTGPVSVNDGALDIQHPNALGSTASGLTITDGTVTLRNVVIEGETLSVRGTKPVSANTAGSFLNCIGRGGWLGRIELDTNLVVNSTGLCQIGGPIVGSGGFEFLGARYEMIGSNSSATPSDYTGLTRALCELLIVSEARPFRGPLMVGGGFSPLCEVRWGSGSLSSVVPAVTVQTNGLVNLNGHGQTFSQLTFHGGRVTTGNGVLAVAGVKTNPTNVVALIEGNLQLSAVPTTPFEVPDGAAFPDLSVNATISDGLNVIGFEKIGDGQIDFHRANTFRGASFVREGTVSVLNDNALGAPTQGTAVSAGATVAFGIQAKTVLEPLLIAGAGVDGTTGALVSGADLWIDADMALSGPAAIRVEGANSRVQVNNLSGTGPLTKLGRGRLVLRGNAPNTYTGDTLVDDGILELAKPANTTAIPGHLLIGTGALLKPAKVEQRSSHTIAGSVTVNRGLWEMQDQTEAFGLAELQGRPPLTLLNGGSVQTGGGILILPAGGDVMVTPGIIGGSLISGRIGLDPGNHRFVIGSGNGLLGGIDCTVNASISQGPSAAGIEKAGPGKLVLGGNNSYAGDTIISRGQLQVEGSQPQSLVRVEGGLLEGVAGIVGPVLLNAGAAAAAPREARSSLVCGHLGGTGVLAMQFDGPLLSDHDRWDVRGAVDLSRLTLRAAFNFSPVPMGLSFMIIENDGADPVIPFQGLPQDATVVTSAGRFRISYTAGDGNDVMLTLTAGLDPSAHLWVNPLGGNWHNPTNWNTQIVPNLSSTELSNPAPIVAITNQGIYTITNDLDVTIGELFYGNGFGTLAGTGSIAIRGPFIWDAGSLAGGGSIIVEGAMHISTAANLTEKVFRAKTLVNKNAAAWAGNGIITLSDSATLSNQPGAIFDCTGDGTMNGGSGSNLVVNGGIFRKTGGVGTTRINVPFQNDGQVEVQSGTLVLNNGGTESGSISVSGGATLEIAGRHDFREDSLLTGAGHFLVNAFSSNHLAGTIDLTGDHTYNSGTIHITGDYRCVGSTLTIARARSTSMAGESSCRLRLLSVASAPSVVQMRSR
ncbi:MAG: autotransporter-associated beta strand repeat-containing protein [Verrucomicrobiota bacterium]